MPLANKAVTPRARGLRPVFKLKQKCNDLNEPLARAILLNMSPARRLRPKPHTCLVPGKGKKLVCKLVEFVKEEVVSQVVWQSKPLI